VAIRVPSGAVTGKIVAGVVPKVSINHTLVVAVDAAYLRGPGGLYNQITGARPVNFGTVFVEQRQVNTEKRQGSRARFQGSGPG
jgi:hypothetical protein